MDGVRRRESALRLAVGSVLWTISGLLTTNLYLALAGGDIVRQGVLGALAMGLEGAKVLTWRMGRAYRIIAVSLIILSMLGSFGASLETVQEFRQSRIAASDKSPAAAQGRQELDALDRQILVLLDRLDHLPPDFVTAGKALTDELDRLRAQRSQLASSLSQTAGSYNPTMFDLLAQVFGTSTETLMLVLLLFLSVNLEAAALVLSGHERSVGQRPTEQDVTSAQFLEAAKEGAALPVLHGRDVTAKKLGISYYRAKKLVRELMESGTIGVVGKRLVLKREP